MSDIVTLKTICDELKIDPREARERLRAAASDAKAKPELAKARKPRTPWQWVKGSAAEKEALLEKHGAGLEHLVEVTSFHKDVRDWETVMAAAADIFPPGAGPAWTPVGCTGLYLEGYQHEIYALAMLPG